MSSLTESTSGRGSTCFGRIGSLRGCKRPRCVAGRWDETTPASGRRWKCLGAATPTGWGDPVESISSERTWALRRPQHAMSPPSPVASPKKDLRVMVQGDGVPADDILACSPRETARLAEAVDTNAGLREQADQSERLESNLAQVGASQDHRSTGQIIEGRPFSRRSRWRAALNRIGCQSRSCCSRRQSPLAS